MVAGVLGLRAGQRSSATTSSAPR